MHAHVAKKAFAVHIGPAYSEFPAEARFHLEDVCWLLLETIRRGINE
jgi:hypothetical protein